MKRFLSWLWSLIHKPYVHPDDRGDEMYASIERPYRSQCTCPCHYTPGMMHCFPCCNPDPKEQSNDE